MTITGSPREYTGIPPTYLFTRDRDEDLTKQSHLLLSIVSVSVDVIVIDLSKFTNFRSTKLAISSCLIFVSVGKEETRKIWNQSNVDVVDIILISALFTLISV